MARRGDDRKPDEKPKTRAPDKSAPMGIAVVAAAVVAAVIGLAVLYGVFGEESVVEETENTMMGGTITGAEVEDVADEEAAVFEEELAPKLAPE